MLSRTRMAAAVFGAIALIAGCAQASETPPETTTSAPPTTATATPGGPRRGPEPSVATPVVANVIAAPGQVIGSVGNTGNSSAPHLHFHVMSTPDPLRSDGLPFVFTGFRLDSRLAVADDDLDSIFDGQPVPRQPGFTARDESNVMPLDFDVMTYAAR